MSHRDKIQKIISESVHSQNKWKKEFQLFGKMFYVETPFIGSIDVDNVINTIENSIPAIVFNEIDMIMVGEFDFLQERELEAMYKDGAIYISNSLFTNQDLVENIVHEAAHSMESAFGYYIYADQRITSEFIGKRETLKRILISHNFDVSEVEHLFADTEYNQGFDDFLHKDVGYAKLNNLTLGLVSNPYALTSLREYWASGFEKYFLGEQEIIKRLSPQLFNKIEGVLTNDD